MGTIEVVSVYTVGLWCQKDVGIEVVQKMVSSPFFTFGRGLEPLELETLYWWRSLSLNHEE